MSEDRIEIAAMAAHATWRRREGDGEAAAYAWDRLNEKTREQWREEQRAAFAAVEARGL